MRSRLLPTAIGALVCIGLGACSSISSDAIDATHRATDPTTTSTMAPTTTTTVPPGCTNELDALESLRPDAPLPTPGEMPAGSYMRTIQNGGRLVAGVDENTLRFSARDPLTGEIDGLEVDIVREIARAITGRDNAVQLKTVVTAQKVPFVKDGKVDLTVSAVSMTCARSGQVGFSTEYYRAEHKLLVRSDSRIHDIGDLAGRKVCVTTGSSSVKVLGQAAPDAVQVPLEARTDCLVALQQGEVEAYFSHDAILFGMQEQDPTTKILDQALSTQHYGIAIAKQHPEFVRFVNAVLERMRADGTLAFLYAKWLGSRAPAVPPAAYTSVSGPAPG